MTKLLNSSGRRCVNPADVTANLNRLNYYYVAATPPLILLPPDKQRDNCLQPNLGSFSAFGAGCGLFWGQGRARKLF